MQINTETSLVGKPCLTPEQIRIITTQGDLAINAVAGSGKTTTLIGYAAEKPKDAKILYLAFNKSVKLEAMRKFSTEGLKNVSVETAHSLAYRYIMRGSDYRLKPQGYQTDEIADLLQLPSDGKHTEYIIANHINKFLTYFFNSDKPTLQDLDYRDTLTEPLAKNFVNSFYKHIDSGTKKILTQMEEGKIDITHDYYLKKFQLSNPELPYDYILFDEGQDASAAMLDVFLKQKAVKIIVGDTHQQIYRWRYAVNSLAKTDFNTLDLSTSFRFPQDIANLAVAVLGWKNQLPGYKPVTITGSGTSTELVSKATIARSNLGLLLNAINFITENSEVRQLYFEGNIHSYTYADEGASLYDVLNLYNGRHDRIRNKLIRSMRDMGELEQYVKSTEDAQLAMMMEIVNEYGNQIPRIIQKLKNMHTGDEERGKAEMIFSTVHRAKGMEYDSVYLVNDFLSESKLERIIKESKDQPLDIGKLNEEINLLYVAVTRAKHKIYIPEALLPKDFPVSPHIEIIMAQKRHNTGLSYEPHLKEAGIDFNDSFPARRKSKIKETGYFAEKRRKSHKSDKSWTTALDEQLNQLYKKNTSITMIARILGKTKRDVVTRLQRINSR